MRCPRHLILSSLDLCGLFFDRLRSKESRLSAAFTALRNSGNSCRLADDQFWLHDDLFRILLVGLRDHIEQDLRALSSHLTQRLANGSEARLVVGSAHDVVKADDRDIFRYA